jgi:hypothetical protein
MGQFKIKYIKQVPRGLKRALFYVTYNSNNTVMCKKSGVLLSVFRPR